MNKTFAATLQETWREGQEELNLRDHTFLLNGPPAQTSNAALQVLELSSAHLQ